MNQPELNWKTGEDPLNTALGTPREMANWFSGWLFSGAHIKEELI